jgi:hypothetical protein
MLPTTFTRRINRHPQPLQELSHARRGLDLGRDLGAEAAAREPGAAMTEVYGDYGPSQHKAEWVEKAFALAWPTEPAGAARPPS